MYLGLHEQHLAKLPFSYFSQVRQLSSVILPFLRWNDNAILIIWYVTMTTTFCKRYNAIIIIMRLSLFEKRAIVILK